MPAKCAAIGCSSKSEELERAYSGTTFHQFPKPDKRPALLKEWLKNLGRDNWQPSQRSKLCSRHFTKDCFADRAGVRVTLKRGAIPTIFEVPKLPDPPGTVKTINELLKDYLRVSCKPSRVPVAQPEEDEKKYMQILQNLDQPEAITFHSVEADDSLQGARLKRELDHNAGLQVIPPPRPASITSHAVEADNSSQEAGQQSEGEHTYVKSTGRNSHTDHSYGSRGALRELHMLQSRNKNTATKLKTCQQKCRRLQRRIDEMSGIIKALRKKQKRCKCAKR